MADICCEKGSNRMIIWCAGAANVGQMTNQIAVELCDEGYGRLFCLAGIAAHRGGFVRSVKDAEDMLVLDGCPIACAGKIIEHVEAAVKNHFVMTDWGVEKKMTSALDREMMDRIRLTVRGLRHGNGIWYGLMLSRYFCAVKERKTEGGASFGNEIVWIYRWR